MHCKCIANAMQMHKPNTLKNRHLLKEAPKKQKNTQLWKHRKPETPGIAALQAHFR